MQASRNLVNLHNQIGRLFAGYEDTFFYKNPIFIVSTPRSGSTLLFEQLTKIDNIWTIGNESHGVFAEFPHLQFENSNMDSACLTAQHADSQTSYLFKLALYSLLRNNLNQRLVQQNIISQKKNVFIEKTPRNALNIPFLRAVFPHAKFIYLYREPKQNVASIIEAWNLGMQTGQFVTFPNLPNWDKTNWCLLLPRGWRNLNGKSMADIAYFQWLESNLEIINNLKQLTPSNWISLDYNKLIKKPYKQIKKIVAFCEIDTVVNKKNYKKLSLSKTVVSTPKKEKWRKHEEEMKLLLPEMARAYKQIKLFCKT